MVNTWEFNIILYIIIFIVFTQFYKLAASKGKNDGALTILIQVLSGILGLIWIPFFKEQILLKKVIGTILILMGNVFVLFEKGKFQWNKYTIFSLLGSLSMSIALIVDVGISEQFNLAIYAALTLSMPAIILLIGERIKIKDITNEFKQGDKRSILIVSFTWPLTIITLLRAYNFGTVGTVAPISAAATILNVFVAYFALKEKNNLLKKILAAVIVVIGIVLIKI